jgi:hypothetical protein
MVFRSSWEAAGGAGGFFSPGSETIGLTICLGSTKRTPRGSCLRTCGGGTAVGVGSGAGGFGTALASGAACTGAGAGSGTAAGGGVGGFGGALGSGSASTGLVSTLGAGGGGGGACCSFGSSFSGTETGSVSTASFGGSFAVTSSTGCAATSTTSVRSFFRRVSANLSSTVLECDVTGTPMCCSSRITSELSRFSSRASS